MSELCPVLKQRFADSNGDPLNGGKLYSYAAGTTTPLATYTDQSGLTPNTNPIILDSSGYADVWIGNSSYKFILYDQNDVLQFSTDNVQSIAAQIAAITSTILSVNVSYTQLQTAALSKSVALFSLPAKSLLKNIIIKHSTAFTGGSISDVYAQIGISGSFDRFINGFDLLQVVGDQVFDNSSQAYIGSFINPTVIYLNAIATGANLSALVQGALTVWYQYETFT